MASSKKIVASCLCLLVALFGICVEGQGFGGMGGKNHHGGGNSGLEALLAAGVIASILKHQQKNHHHHEGRHALPPPPPAPRAVVHIARAPVQHEVAASVPMPHHHHQFHVQHPFHIQNPFHMHPAFSAMDIHAVPHGFPHGIDMPYEFQMPQLPEY